MTVMPINAPRVSVRMETTRMAISAQTICVIYCMEARMVTDAASDQKLDSTVRMPKANIHR